MLKKSAIVLAVFGALSLGLPLSHAAGGGGGAGGAGGAGGGGGGRTGRTAGGATGTAAGGAGRTTAGGATGAGAAGATGATGAGGRTGYTTGGYNYDPVQNQLAVIQAEFGMVDPGNKDWAVLSKHLQKVLEDLQELQSIPDPLNTRNNFGTAGGRTPVAPDPSKALAYAMYELESVAASPGIAEKDLESKVNAVLEASQKVRAQLHEDREALRKLLKIRQETVLIYMGVLD